MHILTKRKEDLDKCFAEAKTEAVIYKTRAFKKLRFLTRSFFNHVIAKTQVKSTFDGYTYNKEIRKKITKYSYFQFAKRISINKILLKKTMLQKGIQKLVKKTLFREANLTYSFFYKFL